MKEELKYTTMVNGAQYAVMDGDDSDFQSGVCAQLGYKYSTILKEFGPGTGRILLD